MSIDVSIDIVLAVIILIIVFLAIGVFTKSIAQTAYKNLAKKHEEENFSLKKKIAEFEGAPVLQRIREAESKQNQAMFKVQDLILEYIKWEGPINQLRLYLSLGTGIILTSALAYIARDFNEVGTTGFIFLALTLFAFAYLFWGNILEIYWKNETIKKMKVQVDQAVILSKNPLEIHEKLLKWMKERDEIKKLDNAKRNKMEDMLKDWIKESAKKI